MRNTAHILTVTDYYPFGSPMAGRTKEQDGYRFGFNGHENINEVYYKGNIIDMGDRCLDTRLGRTQKPDTKGALDTITKKVKSDTDKTGSDGKTY